MAWVGLGPYTRLDYQVRGTISGSCGAYENSVNQSAVTKSREFAKSDHACRLDISRRKKGLRNNLNKRSPLAARYFSQRGPRTDATMWGGPEGSNQSSVERNKEDYGLDCICRSKKLRSRFGLDRSRAIRRQGQARRGISVHFWGALP